MALNVTNAEVYRSPEDDDMGAYLNNQEESDEQSRVGKMHKEIRQLQAELKAERNRHGHVEMDRDKLLAEKRSSELKLLIVESRTKCLICLTRDRECQFQPCGHVGFCDVCANAHKATEAVLNRALTCPVCHERAEIKPASMSQAS